MKNVATNEPPRLAPMISPSDGLLSLTGSLSICAHTIMR